MIRITLAAAVEARAITNRICAEVFDDVTHNTPVLSEAIWRSDGQDYCVASLEVPEQALSDLAAKANESGLSLAFWIAGDESEPPRASQQSLCILAGVDSRYAIDVMGLSPAT